MGYCWQYNHIRQPFGEGFLHNARIAADEESEFPEFYHPPNKLKWQHHSERYGKSLSALNSDALLPEFRPFVNAAGPDDSHPGRTPR